MSEGYVNLWRNLLDWEWYDDMATTRLWIHILLKSNWKTGYWHGEEIKAGSFVTSSLKLASETGLSRQQVRTSLNKLESTNEITIKSTNRNTLISVVNWAKYQGLDTISNQQINQVNNQQITINQPSNNHQITTIETGNKVIKKELNILSGKNDGNMDTFKEAIAYLNKRTGKHYKCSEISKKHVYARINEGYTLEDFKRVVDNQVAKWMGTKMEDYLRPQTLFGTKMDGYLNGSTKKYHNDNHIVIDTPDYISKQMRGEYEKETPASKEDVDAIKRMLEEMDY